MIPAITDGPASMARTAIVICCMSRNRHLSSCRSAPDCLHRLTGGYAAAERENGTLAAASGCYGMI